MPPRDDHIGMMSGVLHIEPDFRARLGGRESFDDLLNLQGEIIRHVATRRTSRIECDGKRYFIKAHFGVGWREIAKNLITLKAPVLGAMNEVRAIRRVGELGIAAPRIVAYGERGKNPARIESFIITEDLGDTVTLEKLSMDWINVPPSPSLKWKLIRQVADIARRLHENGVNHRDFYICHFRRCESGEDERLYLMDLHRAQMRRAVPYRWLVKDLGALYFSSMDIGLTKRDRLRFLVRYRGESLRNILGGEESFWRDTTRRARRLYNKPVR